MSGKRLYSVIDKEEPRWQSVSYQGIPCTARHCCTNLNRLTEENEQLKEDNEQLKEEYKIAIDELITDYKKLEKENEMLRILLKDIYVDDELRKLAERYGVENE